MISQARPPMGWQVSFPGSFLRHQGKRGLDIGAEFSSLGRAPATPLHPRESRHDDILPEQEVTHLSQGVKAAELRGKVLLCHPARGAQVVHHPGAEHHEAAGCRREDLRMAHTEEGTEGNLHSGHMVYTTALVEDMLTEISEWLENHPREVVILACRNFEYMMEDPCKYLMGCIKNIFGDMLCPHGVIRGHRLPMLSVAGALGTLGFTVIRLSAGFMRLIQAPDDAAHRTRVIHPPLSPLKHPQNLPITAQDTPITHPSPSPLRHSSNLPTRVYSDTPIIHHDCLFSQRTQ
ncbi:unnamed protein product [Rangifer tarandus platyrhynchus]|uniref:Uncharacterized protein n=1 Tax=Rangifer tarandus platyrhynchus TaxID=3082113 RepID=A0ABN9A1J3_RANTA|nr:unnamed protein product [Rangifer tarandus platyrhynchus]